MVGSRVGVYVRVGVNVMVEVYVGVGVRDWVGVGVEVGVGSVNRFCQSTVQPEDRRKNTNRMVIFFNSAQPDYIGYYSREEMGREVTRDNPYLWIMGAGQEGNDQGRYYARRETIQ